MYNNSQNPIQAERVLSALSYLTFGTVGIIWLIVAHLKKMTLKQFLRFNIIQSLIISLLITALGLVLNFIESLLSLLNYIPFLGTWINSIFQFFIFYIAGFTIIRFGTFGFSLLHILYLFLIGYTCFCSIRGDIPEIPIISNNIRRMF